MRPRRTKRDTFRDQTRSLVATSRDRDVAPHSIDDDDTDTAVEIIRSKPSLDTVQGEIVVEVRRGLALPHGKIKTIPFAREPRRGGIPFRIGQSESGQPVSQYPRVGHQYLNYRLEKQLARGSMGVVYQAVHCHLDRLVAIKFLSPHLLPDPNMVYRFLREAKAMAKLHDPGIPTVFDFGQDPVGNAYLVMEYFDGKSLAEHLAHSPLSLSDALELSAQTSLILATAHQAGIVHRDLKPDNIILSPSPCGLHVKIIDFGVCKVDAQTKTQVETVAGNLLGTPTYMAPEQTYACSISPKADTYALGCILYELISGQPPFGGQLAALVDAHRHETAPRLDRIVKEIPTKLAALVGLMMAKDPTSRPASGAALADAIRSFRSLRQSRRSSHEKNATATNQLAIQTTSMPTTSRESHPPSEHTAPSGLVSSGSSAKPRRTLPPPRPDTAQSALDSGRLHPEVMPTPSMMLAMPTVTRTGFFAPRREPAAFPANNTGFTATTQLSVASTMTSTLAPFLTSTLTSTMLRIGVTAVIAVCICSALAALLL